MPLGLQPTVWQQDLNGRWLRKLFLWAHFIAINWIFAFLHISLCYYTHFYHFFFLVQWLKIVLDGFEMRNVLMDSCDVTERVIWWWRLRDLTDGVYRGFQTGWTQTAFIVLYISLLLGVLFTPSVSQLYLNNLFVFSDLHFLWNIFSNNLAGLFSFRGSSPTGKSCSCWVVSN